jgi:hypothetical protein
MPYLQKEHCRCENLFSPSYQLYRSFSSPSCLFSSLPFNRFAGYSFFMLTPTLHNMVDGGNRKSAHSIERGSLFSCDICRRLG